MVGDKVNEYNYCGDEITQEEYGEYVADGLSHECAMLTISPVDCTDLEDIITVQLYAG